MKSSTTLRVRSRTPLGPARRRRRRALVITAAAIFLVVVWARHGDFGGETQGATKESGGDELPVDRLLTLQAPTIHERVDAADFPEVRAFEDEVSRELWLEGELQSGQVFTSALREAGVPLRSAYPAIEAIGELFDFRRAQAGHTFEVELDSQERVILMRYQVSPERLYEAERQEDGGFEARQADIEVRTEVSTLAATLQTNVFQAVGDAGESSGLAQRFTDVFRWDIDFARDARPGDALRMLYERLYLDGEFLRYGRILAAEYRGARRSEQAYFFDDEDERGYYTPEGEPLRRMFLAAPVQANRISSPFDRNRMHPILNEPRPHLGVDYAAPTGTPVWAAADGTVRTATYHGGYGNLVVIRHRDGYETAYAHLHRFASGIRSGARVRQGQVIGQVGTTGLSTGPHLHYELRLNGRHIDPLSHEHQRASPLTGRSLADFQRKQSRLQIELEEVPLPDVEPIDDEDDDYWHDYEDLHFHGLLSAP